MLVSNSCFCHTCQLCSALICRVISENFFNGLGGKTKEVLFMLQTVKKGVSKRQSRWQVNLGQSCIICSQLESRV